MSFITTGFRELALKVRRQRTRFALRHERRVLKKSEISLGREGISEAANFPEVRNEIVALKKLEQEQREFAVRIAQIEEALKKIDEQRQENSREQAAALARLEEEKRPLVEQRNAAKTAADGCEKELATVEQRLRAANAADEDLLKKLSALQATEPPPPDLQTQMERIAAERARLPNEKAELLHAQAGSSEACRIARENLAAADSRVAAADRNIAKVRGEFEARDRALNESSRAQQEEVRLARQQHQTVEEKKNPAYLNIGRHLATQGIAPPNAPHLLAEVQRNRAAVDQRTAHKSELDRLSSQINQQELRKFYFALVSVLVLLAIVLPLASQSPPKRDWLPRDTSTIFSISPLSLTNSAVWQNWRKDQPELWRNAFAGLAGPAMKTPAVDPMKDLTRVTRALTMDENGNVHDYVLVEVHDDLGPVLRTLSQDSSFTRTTVSGLVVSTKPEVAVARVGAKTLAVGSLGEVDQLVQVRLGTAPDLKIDDPLQKAFQGLESESTLRLVSRDSGDLSHFFAPILAPALLTRAQMLGLAVVVNNPIKAHMFVRLGNVGDAKELARTLQNDFAPLLTIPGSDFVLATQAPKVEQNGTQVDLHFEIPDGAARLLLQRLANVKTSG